MNHRTVSSAANQKWARFPHRGTLPVQTYANLFASPIIHLYGRKIFRPYKWMIGDAKRFAHVWTGIVSRCGNRAHFWFTALDTVRSFA